MDINLPILYALHCGDATIQLTGGEYVTTKCPECGGTVKLDWDEFISVFSAENFDLYGSRVYCDECSKERRKNSDEILGI